LRAFENYANGQNNAGNGKNKRTPRRIVKIFGRRWASGNVIVIEMLMDLDINTEEKLTEKMQLKIHARQKM